MKKHVWLLGLFMVFACTKQREATSSLPLGTAAATQPAQPREPSSSKAAPTATRAGKWAYEKTLDGEGSPVFKAFITSPDSLRFGFPYTAGSTATLTIRQRNGSSSVYLEVSNGQFNRSFQGGNVRIRFDAQLPTAYSFSAAANGRANIIFFDLAQPLIHRIKAARKMVINIEFYAQGSRSIEFSTAGLVWNH